MASLDPQLMLTALANLQARGAGMQNPDMLAAELGRASGSTDLNSLLEQAQAFIKGGSESLTKAATPTSATPSAPARTPDAAMPPDGPGGSSGGSAGPSNVSGSLTGAGRGALSAMNVLGTQLGPIAPFSFVSLVNSIANASGVNTPGVTSIDTSGVAPGMTLSGLGMNQSVGIQGPSGSVQGLDMGTGPNSAITGLAALGQALGLGPNPSIAAAGNINAMGLPPGFNVFASHQAIPGTTGPPTGRGGFTAATSPTGLVDEEGNIAGAATGNAPAGSTNFSDAPGNTSGASASAGQGGAQGSADTSEGGPGVPGSPSAGVGVGAGSAGASASGDSGGGVGSAGEGFKKGGRIPNKANGGAQTINAHEGEYVLNPTASAAFWPLLDALNKLVPFNEQMTRAMSGASARAPESPSRGLDKGSARPAAPKLKADSAPAMSAGKDSRR